MQIRPRPPRIRRDQRANRRETVRPPVRVKPKQSFTESRWTTIGALIGLVGIITTIITCHLQRSASVANPAASRPTHTVAIDVSAVHETLPTPALHPTPTNTPSPTPIPTPTVTPTPTPDQIRQTLLNLLAQAKAIHNAYSHDDKLRLVAEDAVEHGYYDIAIDAAKSGRTAYTQSGNLLFVGRCIAYEGWFDIALDLADHMKNPYDRETIRGEVFDMRRKLIDGQPLPPKC